MEKLCSLMIVSVALVLLGCFSSSAANVDKVSYDGYKVIRADSASRENFNILTTLRTEGTYDFWAGPHMGRTADIMVAPQQQKNLESFLKSHGISFNHMISDVGLIVAEEASRSSSKPQAGYNWDDYHPLETIYTWLSNVESSNPNLVKLINVGKSSEGRDLTVVKISKGGNPNKPAIWIDGTIHAREWIATSTATYVINQLVSNSTLSSKLLESTDFYILPVVNPDGYEYSRLTDRMWRKTRSILPNSTCKGVDANRNFGFKWENASQSGVDKCSLLFPGENAFSEPEAVAVQDFILKSTQVNFQGFITLHSYSQLWMTPWGYTTDLPVNYNEMMRVANKATAALGSVHGTSYQAGSASNILYGSTGTSRDWAKGVPNITYVYTIELRDTGRYGFVLPPDQIIPTGEETWAGIAVAAQEISAATQGIVL